MKRIAPWRLALGLLAVAYIVYVWVRKDIGAVWASIPQEELLPVVLTSVAVSALKIVAIAATVFLVRWLLSKFSKK